MGSFYTNVTLIGPPTKKVMKWLGKHNRQALVASEHRYTVVFDAGAEAQDGSNATLARDLSSEFRCPVIAVTVHDDSVLYLDLFEGGRATDRYNSSPGYFTWDGDGELPRPEGGNADELVRLCGAGDRATVEKTLRGEYVFENERHRALAEALELPLLSHGTGYQYLADGEYPPGTDARTFTRA
jgi:hypothetical protein